jgi:hypothetical protein
MRQRIEEFISRDRIRLEKRLKRPQPEVSAKQKGLVKQTIRVHFMDDPTKDPVIISGLIAPLSTKYSADND